MLQHLTIKNYALINELDIDLNRNLTTITGETGAGKSILLGALGLIIGQRADTAALLDKDQKCIVEGVFDVKQYGLADFFARNELDYQDISYIRREINPNGNSRAFINDTPVNLAVLKELGTQLIDIHSQHQTLALNEEEFQLNIVDYQAGNEEQLTAYKTQFREHRNVLAKWKELLAKESEAKKEADYLQFQFDELENARLVEQEQQQLEEELQLLSNAENIKQNLAGAYFLMDEAEGAVLTKISEIRSQVNAVAKFSGELGELAERVNSAYIELKDISNELSRMNEETALNNERQQFVSDRLNLIYKLQQKHQVKSIAELLSIHQTIGEKLGFFSSLESQISGLEAAAKRLEEGLKKMAATLTANRKKVIPALTKEIEHLLHELGMENALLQIQLSTSEELNAYGQDKVKFLFTANKGFEAKELSKVASGGELSRLMLSLKSVMAAGKKLPTIIFDEIDTGVSGDVADKMGRIMQKMAAAMQVITITHLPQIASKGSQHLFVYKEIIKDKTNSQIKYLDEKERINEIAKMLSSGNPSDAAISNAKELLKKVF